MSDHDIEDDQYESQPPSLAKPKANQKITAATFASKYKSSKFNQYNLIDPFYNLEREVFNFLAIDMAIFLPHYENVLIYKCSLMMLTYSI